MFSNGFKRNFVKKLIFPIEVNRIFIPFVLIVLLFGSESCRTLVRNLPNIDDYKIFKKGYVSNANPKFEFKQNAQPKDYGNTIQIRMRAGLHKLDKILDEEKSVAFIIIRNDTILYEKYMQNYTDSSLVTSFSIAKSVTCALTGIAIGEGKIKSVDEPIINYLPELKERNGMEKVKIEHLLSMTSGLRFAKKNKNPLIVAANFYYKPDLKKELFNNAEVDYAPGTKFAYENGNTELMALILERTTGKKLNEYLEEKIWKPLGMESDAIWSRDNDSLTKAFCCLNARARDFARYGRLFLNGGKWEGQQIIPENWVKRSLSAELHNGAERDYHYHWVTWAEKLNVSVAGGLYNQYVFLAPDKNTIIVHFAKKREQNDIFWKHVLLQTLEQL